MQDTLGFPCVCVAWAGLFSLCEFVPLGCKRPREQSRGRRAGPRVGGCRHRGGRNSREQSPRASRAAPRSLGLCHSSGQSPRRGLVELRLAGPRVGRARRAHGWRGGRTAGAVAAARTADMAALVPAELWCSGVFVRQEPKGCCASEVGHLRSIAEPGLPPLPGGLLPQGGPGGPSSWRPSREAGQGSAGAGAWAGAQRGPSEGVGAAGSCLFCSVTMTTDGGWQGGAGRAW